MGLVGHTGMSYVYVFRFSDCPHSHILRREWQVDTCYEHAALCKDILGFLAPTAYVYLLQVDPTSGRIKIDGIDISTIGVHDLRSRLVSPSQLPRFSRSLTLG